MTRVPRNRVAVFFALAILGCAADLGTKSWIFQRVGFPGTQQAIENEIAIVPGNFTLTTSLNEGALFGIGQGGSWLFAAMSCAAAVGILYWLFYLQAAHDWWLTVALGCVMAGIFGNLYDRLGLPGLTWPGPFRGHVEGDPVYAVRDWLFFRTIHWPIFNLADCFLVVGAGTLLVHAFFSNRKEVAEKATAA